MVRLTASARKKFTCSKSVKTPQRSIKYKQPAYPDDEVLHMDHIAPVGQKLLSAGTSNRQLAFAPQVNFKDYVILLSVIDILAIVGLNFKNSLRFVPTGNPTRTQAVDINDSGDQKLAKAPDLRYLEFCGVYQDLLYGRQLDHITLRRPKLEIVYEWNDKAVLIRGSQGTPLPTRQDHETAISRAGTTNADPLPQNDEDTREDATDSEEERRVARKARKTHRKTRDMRRQIRNLGKQRSMSMIMGREIYGFEMGKSFRGDLDYSDDDDDDDDDDVDPRKMKQELKMMEEGFGFDD
ncbi:hypothetical protein PSPO01_06434 [Paraphaeosphaeria sporulosa]